MRAVVGLGFGDEGKGLTTSFLCSLSKNPLVVRFNGGHQAGHTVMYEGNRHVFSNFGSGTLQGAATYWSRNCTFSPECVVNEYSALVNLGLDPVLYVDDLCPVTTPYDIFHNMERERVVRHGSVGMGFGSTLQRQSDYFNLFVQDLQFKSVVLAKLNNIANYYGNPNLPEGAIERFLEQSVQAFEIVNVKSSEKILFIGADLICEGAQGVLLDQDFGFFPNVTRSNTTCKNAFELCGHGEIFYATRTYQTRHGNGFMTNEHLPLELVNTENETNNLCEWQGTFRKSVLDIDLLNYALKCDSNYSRHVKKNLVISCVDQTGYDFNVTEGGILKKINLEDLPLLLGGNFKRVFYSTGPSYTDIKPLR